MSHTTRTSDRLLTARELADTLQIGEATVRRLVDERVIPALRVDARRLRFRLAEVEAALRTIAATEPTHLEEARR